MRKADAQAPPGTMESYTQEDCPNLPVMNNSAVDSGAEAYLKFMKKYCCYDAIPTSCKLVIFDTALQVKKAFFALVANGLRAAPLWDSKLQRFVGMLTITDFINILHRYYKSPMVQIYELEDHKIQTWRDVYLQYYNQSLISITPDARDQRSQHHDFCRGKLKKRESGLSGTSPLYSRRPQCTTLCLFSWRDECLHCLWWTKMNLAAQKTYNNLSISMKEALRRRRCFVEGVIKCYPDETLETAVDRIAKAEVHRLVLVDRDDDTVRGIISLSDLLQAMILSPAGIDALLA
ncbi:5'-AMP-activated protein kinase subunit gamma-1 isoform X5 [Tachysurus fulvidraco]|uniref:5'-AMP-activated protein kinase subunit gamma-1 isoform X5 n=1 Tax=Tachysurus fulvidraco TaxID=1234273 RepID=UPI000F4EA688|nr:5'-AMP-activated protein kinase subunit gamma-1 isoform X5 [Tachysurus fulvidraco]